MGPCWGKTRGSCKKALRLAAVNIVSGLPYLDGLEEHQDEAQLAVELLEVIRGSQRLGLSGLSVKDFTSRQFHLVSYLSARIDEYRSKTR